MTIYQIDPSHSNVNFSVKHMMISKVHGGFEKLKGTFTYDPKNVASSHVEITIEADSIATRNNERDKHLRSSDFLDVEKYPHVTFTSTSFKQDGKDLKVTGDLTIHGTTRSVVLDIEGPTEEHKDPWGNMKIGVSGSTKIKRKDFGLSWNAALEAGGVLVGDDISITLDVQLIKQGDAS